MSSIFCRHALALTSNTPFTLVTREITRVIHRVISRVTFLSHWREGYRVNFSRRLLCSGSTYVCIYGACIQSPRAPELSWKKRKHSIRIWRMHIHFVHFVLWRNNDRPDFTREFNRDAFHAATSPGCTRKFTWDDSRVTFPKSLAAFYPAFHPRDLSRCDITRVHPGEICSAWKGYKLA